MNAAIACWHPLWRAPATGPPLDVGDDKGDTQRTRLEISVGSRCQSSCNRRHCKNAPLQQLIEKARRFLC